MSGKDIRAIAVDVLERAEREKIFVDEALDRARGGGLSRQDRALLTQIVLGTTRHRLTLDYLTDEISGARDIEEGVRPVLRAALFQLLFLRRAAAYAVVDAAVRRTPPRARGFVNAVLRKMGRELEEFSSPADDPKRLLPRPGMEPLAFRRDVFPEDPLERMAVIYSHPLWLVERWVKRRGPEATEAVLQANNVSPPLTIRCRGPREEVAAMLQAEGVETRPGSRPESLMLSKAGKVSSLRAFQEGLFQVQDETQMGVAPLLQGAGLVADLCSAPGGKTVHLADLGARVVALDVTPNKIRLVAESTARLKSDVSLLVADGRRPPLKQVFDGVLVDAPCSNTGVLSRRVDARWRLRPKDVTAMTGVQRALLAAARALVKPGGKIVYSTCSIEPEENEDVAGPGATTLPTERACGGFAAVVAT